MNTTELKVSENTYELKLTTRGVVKLENAIKQNPISLFVTENGGSRIPTVTEVGIVLYYALQPNHPEVKNMDAVYDIIDKFVEEEGTFNDLVSIVIDLFQTCGIFPKVVETEDNEKN